MCGLGSVFSGVGVYFFDSVIIQEIMVDGRIWCVGDFERFGRKRGRGCCVFVGWNVLWMLVGGRIV